MAKFKKGDAVRQIMSAPYTGVVDRFTFDEGTGEISVVMSRKDADGVVHECVFKQDEVELVAST